MRVRVHIQRLVLQGVPLGHRQQGRLGAAVIAEVERRLARSGVPREISQPASVASLGAPDLRLGASASVEDLGRGLGRAVSRTLGSVPRREELGR
jgi:hypothetical protein